MSEPRAFHQLLQNQWSKQRFVCVGLDPVLEKIPEHLKGQYTNNYDIIFEFLKRIIDDTAEIVCAYKPNIAFFEQYGLEGEKALVSVIQYLHRTYPEIPVIGDFKRGDIGNTNAAYAKAAFEVFEVDAITLSPYLGSDTLDPFNNYPGKGLILLCRTSNPGSAELQEMPMNINVAKQQGLITREEFTQLQSIISDFNTESPNEEKTVQLYELIAFLAQHRWNKSNNLLLVIGATHPEAFATVRKLAPNLPFLIPGIGTQGGSLEETLKHAPDTKGQGFIINSSSSILYASKGEDFGEAAKAATLKMHQEIVNLLTNKSEG